MKRRFVFCLGAMLFAGTLAAQTPVPEWQAGVDKVKSLIKANPEQASDAAGELLKGKNKKNVEPQYIKIRGLVQSNFYRIN